MLSNYTQIENECLYANKYVLSGVALLCNYNQYNV